MVIIYFNFNVPSGTFFKIFPFYIFVWSWKFCTIVNLCCFVFSVLPLRFRIILLCPYYKSNSFLRLKLFFSALFFKVFFVIVYFSLLNNLLYIIILEKIYVAFFFKFVLFICFLICNLKLFNLKKRKKKNDKKI